MDKAIQAPVMALSMVTLIEWDIQREAQTNFSAKFLHVVRTKQVEIRRHTFMIKGSFMGTRVVVVS